jgi:hypothetical protein
VGDATRYRLHLRAQSSRLLVQSLDDGRRWREVARADLITWGPCRRQWQARASWVAARGWHGPTTTATRAEAEGLLLRAPRDDGDPVEVLDHRSARSREQDEGRQLELPGTERAR